MWGTAADSSGVSPTIRTTCPACGEVDLRPEEIRLEVPQDVTDGEYGFRCPACAQDVSKEADATIVALLVSAGVRQTVPLGPLSLDDMIELHFALEAPDAAERFLQGV